MLCHMRSCERTFLISLFIQKEYSGLIYLCVSHSTFTVSLTCYELHAHVFNVNLVEL